MLNFNELPMIYLIIGLILMLLFFRVGLMFPDIDQKFKILLGHRSIITHSALIIFIILFLKKGNYIELSYNRELQLDYTRYVIAGFSLGIALHLLYDLVPKSWLGTALIRFPFGLGGFGKGFSIIFLLINASLLIYISIIQMKTNIEFGTGVLFIILTFIRKRKYERGFVRPFIFALLFYVANYINMLNKWLILINFLKF